LFLEEEKLKEELDLAATLPEDAPNEAETEPKEEL